MSHGSEKISFFGVDDNKLIYDERKKRFVQTEDLPRNLTRQYRNNVFKHVSRTTSPHPSPATPRSLRKRTAGIRLETAIRTIAD